MTTSLRLFGDRELAGSYWGEAKRLLFQLRNVLQTGGVPTGSRARVYEDGTVISVRSFFGNAIIEIVSPFLPEPVKKPGEKIYYILCYRSGTLKKIYAVRIGGDSFVVTETGLNPDLNLIQLSTATAMTILEDGIPSAYVLEYGLSFGDWLKHATTLTAFGQAKTYDDRYLYHDRGNFSVLRQFNFRLIESFLATTRWSYKTAYYYYPKLTDPEDNTIEWTKALHSDYGVSADIRGKNNITLNDKRTYATSWGERIHESADASYSFFQNYGGGTITDPWQDEPDIIYLESWMWPIVASFNPIKKPKVYTLQYETDAGSQESALFSESLNWSDNWTYNPHDGYTDYSRSLTAAITNYWILAAMGDRKPLHIKNSFTASVSEELINTLLASGPYGDSFTREGSGTRTEQLTQELRAGADVLDTATSTATHTWSQNDSFIWNDAIPVLNESRYYHTALNGDFNWIEPLDYFNQDGKIIVFYKKIRETLQISKTNSSITQNNQSSGTYDKSQSATAVRTVEYWLAWKFGTAVGKEKLATFTVNQTSGMTDAGDIADPGDPEYSFSLTASGERIYGVSCQLTDFLGAFSFNKETFNGIGSTDYYKTPAYGNDGITDFYIYYFGGGTTSPPFVYPFPLEDGNNIIDGGPYAWTGKFCVGAIIVGGAGRPGKFAIGEFDNQTDIVAATGIVAA